MKALLLPFLFLSAVAQAEPLVCADMFTAPVAKAQPAYEKIYPAGIDPIATPGGFMQIGYESEYLFSEAAALIRDYAPAEQVMPKAEWQAKTDEQRLAWLKDKFQNKPEHAAATGLFKQIDSSYMPNELIVDSTGNVEIVLAPFDTYGEWEQAIDEIVARYGAGSQQAMISKPREAAFTSRPTAGVRALVNQALGWLNFTNLRDTFAKLQSGAARFKKDPTKLSAQFMDHPFLGPMTKLKRDIMEKYLKANAVGDMYDDASKQFVRKRDLSFKYTGGPSYRPDVAGPDRFSWEIRNAHKDVNDLKMKVKRDLVAHAHGLDSYQAFANVPAFDSIEMFQRFDAESQAVLIDLFPSKADPRFNYPADDLKALEMYRNFALPLQDHSVLAKALLGNSAGEQVISKRIATARLAYTVRVHQTAEKLRLGQITRAQAKADIMGFVCIWGVDSGLSEAFDVRSNIIGHEVRAEQEKPAVAKAG